MEWLLFLVLPGALLTWCQTFMDYPTKKNMFCVSCDEFVDQKCKRNLGVCQPRYPDFACQTKELYVQHYTGEYVYKFSILSCPKRCVEYVRIVNQGKQIFSCCNENYCNNVSVKGIPYSISPHQRLLEALS